MPLLFEQTPSEMGSETASTHRIRPDFKKTESQRPPWSSTSPAYTQTKLPSWTIGSGATDTSWENKRFLEIDPAAEDRTQSDNNKLMVGGFAPRLINLYSTVSPDGVHNLAPMCYAQAVGGDPAMFVLNLTGQKDTLSNLLETKECTLNVVSEWFIEASNICATNAPPEISEWELSGLHKSPSTHVKPPRVAESAWSAECKLVDYKEWYSKKDPNKVTCTSCFLEAVNFWVREDVLLEGDKNVVDPRILKPVARLGGITHSRITDGLFEIPMVKYEELIKEKNSEIYDGAVSTD